MWFAVWTGNEMRAMFRYHVDAVAYARLFTHGAVAPIAPPDVPVAGSQHQGALPDE